MLDARSAQCALDRDVEVLAPSALAAFGLRAIAFLARLDRMFAFLLGGSGGIRHGARRTRWLAGRGRDQRIRDHHEEIIKGRPIDKMKNRVHLIGINDEFYTYILARLYWVRPTWLPACRETPLSLMSLGDSDQASIAQSAIRAQRA